MPDSARICIAAMLLFLAACQPDSKVASNNQTQQQEPFIHPAFKGVDIAYETYSLQAEKGGVIYHPSGSIVEFPANSLVDKNGRPITGKVNISYREFSDPIDFFVAGIPMEYTEGGTKYTFESSGMCDIRADKDGVPVFINPANKPSLHIASHNADTSHNVYYLDTIQKKWILQGKDFIYYEDKAKNIVSINNNKVNNTDVAELEKPLLPIKVSGNKPVIKLEIDPASVPELLVYNNLQFEIDDDKWDVSDTAQQWEDIKLEKINGSGNYKVGLQSGANIKWYKATPVLEGKDYTDAVKIYDAKMNEYAQLYESRLKAEIEKKMEVRVKIDAFWKSEKEMKEINAKIEEMNKLVLVRNIEWRRRDKEIEMLNKLAKEKSDARKIKVDNEYRRQAEEWKRQTEEWKRKEEEWRRQQEIAKANAVNEYKQLPTYDKVLRSFSFSRFGVYNCDKTVEPTDIVIYAIFVDSIGTQIKMNNTSVVFKNRNSIMVFNTNQITINPNYDNMIFGTEGNKLIYLKFEQFRKYEFHDRQRKYTFKMNVSNKNITSAEDIKRILNI